MKKFITLGVIAMSMACASGERAAAWHNFQLSTGLNIGYASGGNKYFWGLIRDGQPGAPDCFHSFSTFPAYPTAPATQPCPVPHAAPAVPSAPPLAPPAVPAPHGHHHYPASQSDSQSLYHPINHYAPATRYYQPYRYHR